jgi:hypothetical protein
MKKLTFIAAITGCFIAAINSSAQGIYAGVGVGYGFPSQVQPFYSNTTADASSTTTNSKSYSLGSGLSVGAYGGYMITNNIGLELGLSEKFNNSITATATSSDPFPSTDIYTMKGNVFGITPAIRLITGSDKLKIYTITGLIIGFPSATLEDNGTHTVAIGGGGTVTNTSDIIYTYSGNVIIGFDGSLGAMYMLSDKIGVFAEITGDFEDWAPNEQLITTDTFNGADRLGGLTTSQKQTNYESSYTTSNTNSAPGSPTQAAKIYLPFSSIGFSVGVHFAFAGGSVASTPK